MTPAKRAAQGRTAKRSRCTAAAALALALASCVCAPAVVNASSSRRALRARDASTLEVKDEGNLRFVKSSGSTLIDEGHANGTIPGNVRVHFLYDGNPNVSAQITIYGKRGTIQARGSGRLSSPSSANPSFSGTLSITGGSGRYSHARGAGKLYGVFHRRSYGMVVQTQGSMRY